MKRILAVLALLAQLTLLAQNNLTIKAGLEMGYKEYSSYYVYGNSGYYNFSGAGMEFIPLRSLQIGGRFGEDQLFEGGISLSFATISGIAYDDGQKVETNIFRKGIYMERYYGSSRHIVFGTGSQLYTYKTNLERTFKEYTSNGYYNAVGNGTWNVYGLEWKVLARLYFGEKEIHSLQTFFSLAGELVTVADFRLDDRTIATDDGTDGLMAWNVGISYALVFHQRR
jgi:hypothetical protein